MESDVSRRKLDMEKPDLSLIFYLRSLRGSWICVREHLTFVRIPERCRRAGCIGFQPSTTRISIRIRKNCVLQVYGPLGTQARAGRRG
jgi:hypothetical protein